MIVALTGASGFVGSHIADELCRRGHTVRCLLRHSSDDRWLRDKPYELRRCSFDDVRTIAEALGNATAVIHTAGVIAARSMEEFMEGNRGVTERMLAATGNVAASGFQRFVHISSLAVCGPSPSLDQPMTEDSPLRPITPYGVSKKAAEEAVRAWGERLPITIIRPPAVYGERDQATLPFFQAIRRGVIPLIGFSSKWISLIHIRDLARGIVDALESNATVGKTYFISSEDFYTWKQIGTTAAAVMGSKAIPVVIPHALVLAIAALSGWIGHLQGKAPVLDYHKGRDIIQRYWICSSERARTDFGYRQELSLERGIAETIEWYTEHGWLRK
ncbi:MAG: NAD-dependent epimerase/dehydratase family protein [Chlorobiota bacterium]|jgi:nucleoside-diphosphate-sugar epimerase|nr:MAG: NAD-dependent epimerase/dehydratase family protein [Chlorobiota bacterium]